MNIEHSVTVSKLRELLSELKDDDVLYPNIVRNLAIIREGAYVGFVNLLEDNQQVEWNTVIKTRE